MTKPRSGMLSRVGKIALAVAMTAGGLTAGLGAAMERADALSTVPGVVTPGTPLTIHVHETDTFSGTVATFTDSDVAKVASDFTATIDWGDGTTTAGTVTGSNGSFTVSGSHAYANGQDFTHTGLVTLTEAGSGDKATTTFTADVQEGVFSLAAGAPINLTEGQIFSGTVASFGDPGASDPAGDFTATIDWGDGTTSAGVISGGGGSYTVTGTHKYLDELGSGHLFLVTVSEPEANLTIGPVGAGVTIGEGDGLTPRALIFNASAGAPFNGVVATFTDTFTAAVPGDFTATINWGDGTTTAGTVGGGGGVLTVSGTHTYGTSGDKAVSAVLTDDAPGTATSTASSTAHLVSPATLSGSGATFSVQETTAFNGTVATYTDTNTSLTAGGFTATIDWGDGTTTAGTVTGSNGSFTVSGTHTYADGQDFTHTGLATLTETVSGNHLTVPFTANVGEHSFVLAAGAPITLNEGQIFSGTVASFGDPGSSDPAGDFTASIDWGDGTSSAGVISGGGGNYTVTGTHKYLDEIGSGHAFSVIVSEPEANFTIGPVGAGVIIGEGDSLTARPLTFDAIPGASFNGLVATFTDTFTAAVPADFTATINWGDGTTTAGTVGGGGGVLTVSGAHTYAANATGDKAVTVTITDDAPGTATSTASSTAHLLPRADVQVTKTGPALIPPGTNGTYTIVVQNNGPSTAQSVQLSDVLAVGTTFVSETHSAGTCTDPAAGTNGTVSCSLGALAPATSVTITITVHVNPSTSGAINNTATITSPTDTTPANNSSTVTTTASCDHTVTGSQTKLGLSGGSWCVVGATVSSGISFTAGTTVVIRNSSVAGTIAGSNGGGFALCGSSVSSVNVSGASGFVLIGDPGDDGCQVNTLGGDLALSSNHAGVEIVGNTLTRGSITLISTTGAGPFPEDVAPELESNQVSGAIGCSGNVPAPINDGHPNTASSRSGQCIGL